MLQLYRLPQGELIATVRAHTNRIDSIAFGPQSESGGLLATASKDGTAHLWKWTVDGVERLMSIRAPSSRPVLSVEFSPDRRELAMLVSNETAVHVWHLDRLGTRLGEMGLGW